MNIQILGMKNCKKETKNLAYNNLYKNDLILLQF